MTKRYEVTRAAVEVQQREVTPEQLEIERIETLRGRFGFLNKQWIAVSFVHMALVMLLFSDGGFITTTALLVMVLGIDLALMWLSTYLELQRRFRQPVGFFPWLAFLFSLLVEWGFNVSALWSHRPSPEVLPDVLSKSLAFVFGTFVALIIYVSATVQARLDRTTSFIRNIEEANRRKAEEHERQRQREAEEREQEKERRRREAEARLREIELRNRSLESHNEAVKVLNPPSEAHLMERRGNGKAAIGTSDIAAILAALHEAGVREFKYAAKIGEVCGWTSPSSSTTARNNLINAGVLRETADGGFVVVDFVEESHER